MTDRFKGKLISAGYDAKTVKGQAKGHATAILYLAPGNQAGHGTVCPMSGPDQACCEDPCLYTAGHGAFSNVQRARIAKTVFFKLDPKGFLEALQRDVQRFIAWSDRKGLTPSVRLNGTSDIRWERYDLMGQFPDLQWYDYTKTPNRKGLPENYHLTWSYSGANKAYSDLVAKVPKDRNIAVVFRGALPKTYLSRKVIDADKTDLRFLDPPGVICGLLAKGKAKRDRSGFVIDATEKELALC